jgi:hypothetical protein
MQAFGVLAVSLIFIQLASGAAFFDAIKEEIGKIYILKFVIY